MIRTLIHISLISLVALTPIFADVPPLINYQGKIAVGGVDFNGNGKFKFAIVNRGVNLSQTATATATVVNGFVVGATINSGGTGYTSSPTVTVSGAGTGAQLTATVSGGIVTGIQVVNPGSGYQAASTKITLGPPAPNLAITTYWSNDSSSTGGSQPAQPVSLSVSGGGYSVLLGDAQIPNMLPIPIEAFKNDDVRLRVWFSDGANGFQLMTPDQRISAVGYAMIAASVQDGAITNTQLADGAVTRSKIAAGSVASNQLASGAVSSDKLATGAVSSDKLVTGAVSSEKLATGAVSMASARDGNILVRKEKSIDLENQGFVLIGVLNNTTLRPITSAPEARSGHTAVWTGTEMIVWGGNNSGSVAVNSGGRYNPTTDSYTATNTTGAPEARYGHTAVWTGTEMIVWGGVPTREGVAGTGGRYNPTTDSWTATNTTGAPASREGNTAIWTGTEMIVWGGSYSGSTTIYLKTGGRYNPTTNTWAATNIAGAPEARSGHTAVWTGNVMIVWGGSSFGNNYKYNTGGRYNPTTDTWVSTNTTSAPVARYGHTAVWTGAEMIVWGGYGGGYLNTGGRYNPTTDTWVSTNTTSAPVARYGHTAVWTDNEMIIWGGRFSDSSKTIFFNTGARYNPTINSWSGLSLAYLELKEAMFVRQSYASEVWNVRERSGHTAIWTGSSMLLHGGTNSTYVLAGLEIITPGQSYLYSKP